MYIDDCNVFGDNNIEFVIEKQSLKDSENYTSNQAKASLDTANLNSWEM